MNKNFKELSNAILANYSGGNKNSAACRQALYVCAVNSILSIIMCKHSSRVEEC